MTEKNLRYELRAYESTNSCRLASFLVNLTTDPPRPILRSEVAAEWAERYPQHVVRTGRRTINGRISNALNYLNVAKVTESVGQHAINVINYRLLYMAAGNLSIVEDEQGVSTPPSEWSERPSAPEHLQPIQQFIEEQL